MKSSTLAILLAVLAILLVCCCATVFLVATNTYFGGGGTMPSGWSILGRGSWQSTTSYRRHVSVEAPAVVTVVNEVGDVNVRAARGNRVSVHAQVLARASTRTAADRLLEQVVLDLTSSHNRAEIRVVVPAAPADQSVSVTLDITVPSSSTLSVYSNVGNIRIDDFEGSVLLVGDVGDITLRDVALDGDSQIRSGVGDVSFEGRLPNWGQVEISSDVGSVRIILPRDSQFWLDASTEVGEIDVEFDLQERRTSGEGIVRRELRGRVGAEPQVMLSVHTGTGSIAVESH